MAFILVNAASAAMYTFTSNDNDYITVLEEAWFSNPGNIFGLWSNWSELKMENLEIENCLENP